VQDELRNAAEMNLTDRVRLLKRPFPCSASPAQGTNLRPRRSA
jgi:hypothetical protein